MISLLNKGRDIALNNGQSYHIIAILFRDGTPIKFGTNSEKTHPIAYREFSDGSYAASMHAEMDVLRYAKRGDSMLVARFLKNGNTTMAKPCKFCLKIIKKVGLNSVKHTDWNGEWREVDLAC